MPRGVNTQDEGRIQGRNVVNANSSNIVSPGIVTDGLVLHLDAGNYESYPIAGTTWYDLSQRRSNGTFINGLAYIRNGGGAISSTATNSYVNITPVPAIAGRSVTVSLWNYGIEAIASSAFWFGGATGRQFQSHLPWSDSTVYFDVGDTVGDIGGGNIDRISKTATADDYQGWHQWAFIKDASADAMYIYRDGSLWHSGTGKTRSIQALTSAKIFSSESVGAVSHTGYIANFFVYTRALPANEVSQNFNATRSRFNI